MSTSAGEAGGGNEGKQGDKDRMSGVVDAAMDALKAVAFSMAWPQYRQLLSQSLRTVRFTASESKVRMQDQCICAMHMPSGNFSLPADHGNLLFGVSCSRQC